MAATFTEFFKSASPLRGGYPGAAMAGGTWGATVITDTLAISTTLASCVIFTLSTYECMQASGPVISLASAPIIGLTIPRACSGSWIAIGY